MIRESEKLPNKVKISLEEGKKIDKEWNDNEELNSYINDCINIENNIKMINKINEKIEKCNSLQNIKIDFNPKENDGIIPIFETIKSFLNIFIIDNIKIESKIISIDESNKIKNWLIESIGYIKNYELIYRATESGDSNSNTFKICKNIPNLLWIMKDKNNNIFGCFHSLSINTSNSYTKDSKLFLYSINKNKKYLPDLSVPNNIYNCSSHIVEFGNNNIYEFVIGEKFLSSSNITFKNGNIFNHNLEISNNLSSISLKELECFKVIQ